jgi:hypothetical protein
MSSHSTSGSKVKADEADDANGDAKAERKGDEPMRLLTDAVLCDDEDEVDDDDAGTASANRPPNIPDSPRAADGCARDAVEVVPAALELVEGLLAEVPIGAAEMLLTLLLEVEFA